MHPVPTNKADTIQSQRYNCFIRNGENAVPKHACPEARVSNPTAGLTLLWARNTFRGNSQSWQFAQEEIGRVVIIIIIIIIIIGLLFVFPPCTSQSHPIGTPTNALT